MTQTRKCFRGLLRKCLNVYRRGPRAGVSAGGGAAYPCLARSDPIRASACVARRRLMIGLGVGRRRRNQPGVARSAPGRELEQPAVPKLPPVAVQALARECRVSAANARNHRAGRAWTPLGDLGSARDRGPPRRARGVAGECGPPVAKTTLPRVNPDKKSR